MMNYVAIQFVEFFVDFWDKKRSHSVGVINMNSQGGWFPQVGGHWASYDSAQKALNGPREGGRMKPATRFRR